MHSASRAKHHGNLQMGWFEDCLEDKYTQCHCSDKDFRAPYERWAIVVLLGLFYGGLIWTWKMKTTRVEWLIWCETNLRILDLVETSARCRCSKLCSRCAGKKGTERPVCSSCPSKIYTMNLVSPHLYLLNNYLSLVHKAPPTDPHRYCVLPRPSLHPAVSTCCTWWLWRDFRRSCGFNSYSCWKRRKRWWRRVNEEKKNEWAHGH